jgi:hypothetical protein
MTDLSPAAQTVIYEYSKLSYDSEIELSFLPLPWERKAVAAAIRAAADQVVPGEFRRHSVPKDVWLERCDIRRQLRAIAAELDGATTTSENVFDHD